MRLHVALNAGFAHRRARTLLAAAGVALGVALGFGVHLVNRAAIDELEAGVREVAGEADLEVRGGLEGFPDALYAALARAPGVAAASPVLDLEAGLPGGGTLRVLGLDPFRAAGMHPALFARDVTQMRAVLEPGTVLLSEAAAARLHLGTGATLRVLVGLSEVGLEVVGTLPASGLRGAAAVVDIATAQAQLGREGRLNRVDLRLLPGANLDAASVRIAAMLPPGTHVAPVEAVQAGGAALSRAYRVNLNVLALVALVTGGFLVFSAQALEVARRRGEHALLRVLGLTRAGLARLVLTEAAVAGAIGAALGIALGYVLAAAAVRVWGADLGAGMFRGLAPRLGFPVGGALAYFAGGVAVALGGALIPALDAARTPPARALKAGDAPQLLARAVPLGTGLALLAAGGALAFAPAVNGIPVAGYASIALMLIGGVLLMPAFALALWRALPLGRRPALVLVGAQLRGAPGQAMVSLAAIVASFSLMVAMAIMVASFRESVDQWLARLLPAPLYLRTSGAGETAFLAPEFEARVRALPQVARVEFLRSTRASLDAASAPLVLIARDAPPGGIPARLPLVGAAYALHPGDPVPAWPSESAAERLGVAPGERFALALGGKRREFVAAGIWRDYARQHGAVVIERAAYAAMTGDARANDAALWPAPGQSAADAERAIRALPGGAEIEFSTPGEIRRVSLGIFDRSFAVTYALEAVAVLVGLFGLSSSLGAITAAEGIFKFQAGAFPGSPVMNACLCAFAPYNIANARTVGYDVVSNRPKASAYRAPGSPISAFAVESALDIVAQKIGMD
ncbi:MAG: FtsX-like permease family protein, partial [Burkholderiales bacterium]